MKPNLAVIFDSPLSSKNILRVSTTVQSRQVGMSNQTFCVNFIIIFFLFHFKNKAEYPLYNDEINSSHVEKNILLYCGSSRAPTKVIGVPMERA